MIDKFVIDPDTGCWLWTAAKAGAGYGVTFWKGKQRYAHRVFYEILVGEFEEPEIDHLCRVISCVNPDHLEPVSHKENVNRSTSSVALKKKWAETVYCPLGHLKEGDNLIIRKNKKGWIFKSCRKCARIADARLRAKKKAARENPNGNS